jgi:hypothetical protein
LLICLCPSSGVGEHARQLECSALSPADGDNAWGFGRMAKRGQGLTQVEGVEGHFGAGLAEVRIKGKDGLAGSHHPVHDGCTKRMAFEGR